ncbi:MAG: hypothetical protein ACHP7N_13440 [Caulobacterales bacterium]
MPVMQTALSVMNLRFSKANIDALVNERAQFEPGKPLDSAKLFARPGTALYRAFKAYFGQMPGGIRASLRAVIHHALSTTPPTQVTFSWAPSYDWELSVWQAPDTKLTRGGITVLIKSRYPDDKHPLG